MQANRATQVRAWSTHAKLLSAHSERAQPSASASAAYPKDGDSLAIVLLRLQAGRQAPRPPLAAAAREFCEAAWALDLHPRLADYRARAVPRPAPAAGPGGHGPTSVNARGASSDAADIGPPSEEGVALLSEWLAAMRSAGW